MNPAVEAFGVSLSSIITAISENFWLVKQFYNLTIERPLKWLFFWIRQAAVRHNNQASLLLCSQLALSLPIGCFWFLRNQSNRKRVDSCKRNQPYFFLALKFSVSQKHQTSYWIHRKKGISAANYIVNVLLWKILLLFECLVVMWVFLKILKVFVHTFFEAGKGWTPDK